MNGQAKGLSDRNTFITCCTEERGSKSGENLRLSSLIPAYSRLSSLDGRKMVEAPDGERGSIMQNALQTEIGTRATRPSEDLRQSQVRTSLEFGRAGWMRGNAEWMNGKAKDLNERNTFFIYDRNEPGSGSEENLRLFSLILA